MKNYGDNNEKRMGGLYERSKFDTFTYGIADRTVGIRIPYDTFKNKKGYLEDRRPESNIDPYRVCSLIFETLCL